MRHWVSVLAAALIVVSAAALAMSAGGETWTIGYDAAGGELPDGAPSEYSERDPVTLPHPTMEGRTFAGWFLDPELTMPVVVLGGDVKGDVTVHACWEDGDLTGRGFVWEVSGGYRNGDIPHSVSGTVASEWIAQRDGEVYSETRYDVEYSWDGGSTTDGRTVTGWDAPGPRGSFVGTDTVDGLPCTVWDDGRTMTWMHHLVFEVKSVTRMDGGEVVSHLARGYGFEPVTSFTPDVAAEHPLSVSGVMETSIGDPLTLVAHGEGFERWLVDGEPAGDGRTLVLDRADPGQSITAVSEGEYTVMAEGESLSDLGFAGAEVTDASGAPVGGDASALSPGLYRAVAPGDGYVRVLDFFVDEVRRFSHSWTHAGESCSVSLDIRYSDVYMYGHLHTEMGGFRGSLDDAGYISGYHTPGDPYVASLLDSLRRMSPASDRVGFASFVLSFVQSLPYITDEDAHGAGDFWAYPLETLWTGGGDCEDTAILYGTLMAAAGYDVAFALFTDHAMSAVAVDCPGFRVEAGGESFVMCETTSDRFPIGSVSAGHLPGDAVFVCRVDVG